jgi:DNA mismatch repair protein MutS2
VITNGPISLPLTDFARATLAWDQMLGLLGRYAASPLGRDWLETLVPSSDLRWIEREHGLVDEMRLLLAEGVRPSLAGLSDPTQNLAKARLASAGAALEVEEIRALLALALAVDGWAATIRTVTMDPGARFRDGGLPGLRALTEPILDANLRPLVESIDGKLLPDGTLADSASPELGRIRREIDRQQRSIEESLRTALRKLAEGGSAQEELITIRGERFVIPVKAEAKRRVQGVVHGASSSGQTVYLEPLETIELNNELVRLFEEELGEMHRIFVAMTAQIGAQADVLEQGAAILATVETLVMRARFAAEYDAVRPRFTSGAHAELRLVAARHPLLEHRLKEEAKAARGAGVTDRRGASPALTGADFRVGELNNSDLRNTDSQTGQEVSDSLTGDSTAVDGAAQQTGADTQNHASQNATLAPPQVVPLSIALEPERRQLIISGPNTGGKSVSLKTTGLLALMGQAGIPVPAFEATLPVLRAVLADIGDGQSIDQNLSTFSGHIKNLNRLSAQAGPGTLVLIDEPGSATDPDEGSALAVAIAEHFLEAGGFSMIATHHTALKIYGEATAGVVNASVGFNPETLAPTYELRQGVPGASAGINIAARLGLAPRMIERARARMTTQALDIGLFLDKLHAEIASLGEERLRLQAEEKALKKERHRLEVEGMQEWRSATRALEQELGATLRTLENQAKEAVQAIEDKAAKDKASAEAERRVARLRREFSDQFTAQLQAQRRPNAMQVAAAQAAAHREAARRDPRLAGLGDTVKLKIGQTGRVTRELDANTVEIAIGSMKMRTRRADIVAIVQYGAQAAGTQVQPTPVQAARKRNVTVRVAEPDTDLRPEINVIGLTADHAEDEVQRFVDQAFLAGLQRVRIVHGTGMGVLRRTLRVALGRHPHVATVTEADQYEGGQGATIVELRQ